MEYARYAQTDAADADLDRVFSVEIADDGIHRPITLSTWDLERLQEGAVQTDAALIILDPLMTRLGAKDTHKYVDVQRDLEGLKRFASRCDVAVSASFTYTRQRAQTFSRR